MSALHLLWIIPVTFMAGYITCGLLCANGRDEKQKPVSSCEHCRSSDTISCPAGRVWCNHMMRYMKADGFCSEGKSKEEN